MLLGEPIQPCTAFPDSGLLHGFNTTSTIGSVLLVLPNYRDTDAWNAHLAGSLTIQTLPQHQFCRLPLTFQTKFSLHSDTHTNFLLHYPSYICSKYCSLPETVFIIQYRLSLLRYFIKPHLVFSLLHIPYFTHRHSLNTFQTVYENLTYIGLKISRKLKPTSESGGINLTECVVATR